MHELYKPIQLTLTEQGLSRFGLFLQFSPPCQALQGIVHSYLQITASRPTLYPVLPDATQAVFISPHGSQIGGAQNRTCKLQILEPGEYFGIRFYPAALRYFFKLNLSEITDQFVESRFFPCRKFSGLHNDIYRYRNFHQRADVCQQWLLQHFKTHASTAFDQALALIYRSFGNIKVSQLAKMVGWSTRHLNRLFQLHTGLSTKEFAQTIRIQQVCRQLYTRPGSFPDTAMELGFYDQSHLINDVKKRLLTTPAVFFEHFMSDFYNT